MRSWQNHWAPGITDGVLAYKTDGLCVSRRGNADMLRLVDWDTACPTRPLHAELRQLTRRGLFAPSAGWTAASGTSFSGCVAELFLRDGQAPLLLCRMKPPRVCFP